MRTTSSKLNSSLRLLHAALGVESIDIYGNGLLLASNLTFGSITDYIDLAPVEYEIEIYKAGTYDTPILSKTLEILPTTAITVNVVLLENTLTLFTLKDATKINLNNGTFLRFINLSPNSPLLALSLPNGNSLFDAVEYLETTGYYPLSSGIYDFILAASGAPILKNVIPNINLKESTFHTLFIIGAFNSNDALIYLLTDDKKTS